MWLIALAVILMLVAGTTLLKMSMPRAIIWGLAGGLVVVLLVNIVSPTVCLQQSKSWRILTAYKVC